jgi:hypothetical protein
MLVDQVSKPANGESNVARIGGPATDPKGK